MTYDPSEIPMVNVARGLFAIADAIRAHAAAPHLVEAIEATKKLTEAVENLNDTTWNIEDERSRRERID